MFTALTLTVKFIKVLFQNRFKIPFNELLEYGFVIFGFGPITLSVDAIELDEFLNQKILPKASYKALFGIFWFDYHVKLYSETEYFSDELREKSTKYSILVLSIFFLNISLYFDKEHSPNYAQTQL